MDSLLLTVDQAAEQLQISRATFYAQYSTGRIGPQFLRIGRCVRIRAKELQNWVDAGMPPRDKWIAGSNGGAVRV